MHYQDFAREILYGQSLNGKLLSIDLNQIKFDTRQLCEQLPKNPGRERKLSFSNEQIPFPKASSLHVKEKCGLALHFFANHELLAIEMMAAALLIYPDTDDEVLNFKKILFRTIQDEQLHLSLYLKRMSELGVELGDFPLNDFFWRSMDKLKSPEEFYAVVALTFESANLDFAQYYEKIFRGHHDFKSADIMKKVFEDELVHVARGTHYLERRCLKNSYGIDLWSYYVSLLPELLTPARAKGISYDQSTRVRAGMGASFVNQLSNYRDEFRVTNRKVKNEKKQKKE